MHTVKKKVMINVFFIFRDSGFGVRDYLGHGLDELATLGSGIQPKHTSINPYNIILSLILSLILILILYLYLRRILAP